MQSQVEINKLIIKAHDDIRALDRKRNTQLRMVEKDIYKLIAREVQLLLTEHNNKVLKSISSQLKEKKNINNILEKMQSEEINEVSDSILNGIKNKILLNVSNMKLHKDSIDEIKKILDETGLELKTQNANFNKNILSMTENTTTAKISLLDKSIKDTDKKIDSMKQETTKLRDHFKVNLDKVVELDRKINNICIECLNSINKITPNQIDDAKNKSLSNDVLPKQKFDVEFDPINIIDTYRNKMSFFSSQKKNKALAQLINYIKKQKETTSLESLISEWLFTYEKTIKQTNYLLKKTKMITGQTYESSTEKFIRELRENYGHVEITPQSSESKQSQYFTKGSSVKK